MLSAWAGRLRAIQLARCVERFSRYRVAITWGQFPILSGNFVVERQYLRAALKEEEQA
jgi:hypothetical protein